MTGADLIAFVKKNPIGVGCGLLSLALVAGIYFRGSEIPDAEAAIAQKSAEAERYAANIKNSAQLKEQLDLLVAANKEIDSRIIHAGQLGLNKQYFYKLESETATKVLDCQQTAIQSGAKGTKNAFNSIGFTVSVQGTLAQLIDFLHHLESGAHYCRVLSATCGGAASNKSGVLTLALNIEILGLP